MSILDGARSLTRDQEGHLSWAPEARVGLEESRVSSVSGTLGPELSQGRAVSKKHRSRSYRPLPSLFLTSQQQQDSGSSSQRRVWPLPCPLLLPHSTSSRNATGGWGGALLPEPGDGPDWRR